MSRLNLRNGMEVHMEIIKPSVLRIAPYSINLDAFLFVSISILLTKYFLGSQDQQCAYAALPWPLQSTRTC